MHPLRKGEWYVWVGRWSDICAIHKCPIYVIPAFVNTPNLLAKYGQIDKAYICHSIAAISRTDCYSLLIMEELASDCTSVLFHHFRTGNVYN